MCHCNLTPINVTQSTVTACSNIVFNFVSSEVAKFPRRDQANINKMLLRASAREREQIVESVMPDLSAHCLVVGDLEHSGRNSMAKAEPTDCLGSVRCA